MTWKRPENVPYPQTYAIVQGKKALPNGKMPRFRIQDLTEDLFEDALVHMKNNFLFDEPFCNFSGVGNDPVALEDMDMLWRKVMSYKCALVALIDNPEEVNDETLPKIVGINMTFPETPDHPDIKLKNKNIELLVQMMDQMGKDADVFKKYNVDLTMYALGLSVDRVYRGNNLGEEILRARFPLGRSLGIPLTTTVFTATFSQQAALRAGFEIVLVWKPEDFKPNGEAVFAECKTNGSYLMAARIL